MLLTMLKSKIHCAVVTEANLHYMGSITIDRALMKATGMLEGEMVQVVNNNNGARIETYIIPGPEGEGDICLNGAAARHFQVGDEVIIMAFAQMTPEEAAAHKARVVFPTGERNQL